MSDRQVGGSLPRWVRRAFWCVVAVEWAVVVGVVVLYGVGAYWVVGYLSCSDAETIYASTYSDAAWAAVGHGDTYATVRARLGEPLGQWDAPDGRWWSYSRHGTSSDNYLERKLRFDQQGQVAEKHEQCYID